DAGLLLKEAHMGFGLGDHEATGDLHLEVAAKLVLKLLPEVDRVALERQGARSCPATTFGARAVVEGKKLGVERARIAAGCQTTWKATLDDGDVFASARQIERGRQACDACADDERRHVADG